MGFVEQDMQFESGEISIAPSAVRAFLFRGGGVSASVSAANLRPASISLKSVSSAVVEMEAAEATSSNAPVEM